MAKKKEDKWGTMEAGPTPEGTPAMPGSGPGSMDDPLPAPGFSRPSPGGEGVKRPGINVSADTSPGMREQLGDRYSSEKYYNGGRDATGEGSELLSPEGGGTPTAPLPPGTVPTKRSRPKKRMRRFERTGGYRAEQDAYRRGFK